MGWASGTQLVRTVATVVAQHVPIEHRRQLYVALVDACEDQDWDNQSEVIGLDPVLDDVLHQRHPWLREEDP